MNKTLDSSSVEGYCIYGGKMRVLLTAAVFFSLFICTPAHAESDITIFKNPKPTCEEKVYVELIKVGEVVYTEDSKEFLVAPWSLAADDSGNIYVYDSMMKKIYKYGRDLKLLTTFGGPGGGPGEFGLLKGMGGYIYIRLAKDNRLYAGDRMNRKVMCFDTSGKLLKETKINVQPLSHIIPVVDSKGNFYFHSQREGVIDVFNPEGQKTSTLIDRKELAFGLFFSPRRKIVKKYCYFKSTPTTILHEIIGGDRLLVYFQASNFFYIVQNNKIKKKLKLWPREALKFYKELLRDAVEGDPEIEGFYPFFHELIVDKDNEKYVYFHFGRPLGSLESYIYQFDIEGNLIKVLFIKEFSKNHYTWVKYKRNGLFYAVGRDEDHNKTIVVYKEKSK